MSKENKSLPFFGIPVLWPYMKKYKGLIIRMVILGISVSLADVIYPLFNRYAVNHFIGMGTLDTLPWFIVIYVALIFTQAIVNYINVNDCAKIEMYMDRDLRNNAFSHLQNISISYYNSHNVGYIHARAMSDSGKIGELIAWHFMNIVWFGSYLVFVLGSMLLLNWKIALFVMPVVPVTVLLIIYFQKKLVHYNRDVRELNSVITGRINEGITGVRSIKTLAVERKMQNSFSDSTEKMYRKSMGAARYSALFSASVTLMSSVALALVLWRGGNFTVGKIIEIGTLSVFMSYALAMLDPIRNLVETIAKIISIQVNIERYVELDKEAGEVFDSPEVIEKYGDAFNPQKENWEPLIGDVEFKDVSFKYPDGDEMVLEHFNLKVPAGTNVAIIGETGAGKSTLVNLVCRFFECTEGQVLIDGRPIQDRSLGWLHSNMGYVLQSPHLFSGTVRDNLRYGKPGATDEQIMEALKKVKADEVVKKLDGGLDNILGEGGDSLSTGEKQLLCIARAMLADPRILILDEATASIDTITEKTVQDAIRTVVKNRTSFVIAHRLSTIADADIILVVRDGKIVKTIENRK